MYRVASKRENAHEDSIWCATWTAVTNLLVTGSIDESVKVWNPNDLTKPALSFGDYQLAIVSVKASADGQTLATSSLDGTIRLYDLSSAKKISELTAGAGESWSLDYHPKQPLVASGSHSGGVNLWDTRNKSRVGQWKSEGKFCMSVAFSPDGQLLASGSYDGVVHIFDTSTGKSLHKLSHHVKAVRGLAFTPDNTQLVTASEDGHLNIYEVKGGQQTGTISAHQSWVLSVDVDRQQKWFASAGADKKVKIFDINSSHQLLHTFDAHNDQVWCIAANPNTPAQANLASVSDDHSLQLYQVKTEK